MKENRIVMEDLAEEKLLLQSEKKRFCQICERVDYMTALLCGGILDPDPERTHAIVSGMAGLQFCNIPGFQGNLYGVRIISRDVLIFAEKCLKNPENARIKDAVVELLALVAGEEYIDDKKQMEYVLQLLTCIMQQASRYVSRLDFKPTKKILRMKAHRICDECLNGMLYTVMEAILYNPFSCLTYEIFDGVVELEFVCDDLDIPGADLIFHLTYCSDQGSRGITLHIGTGKEERQMLLSRLNCNETVRTLNLIGKVVKNLYRGDNFYAEVSRAIKEYYSESSPLIQNVPASR